MSALGGIVAIAVVLILIGLPFSLALLSDPEYSAKRLGFPARVLLAPAAGLALFAVFTGVLYAFGRPVRDGLPILWLLVGLAWIGVAIWSARRWRLLATVPRQISVIDGLIYAEVVLGLLAVLGAFAWPFFAEPDLVFWHYAGSDGYMYMRIAEHVGWVGTAVEPRVGVFDADAGFLAEEMRHFNDKTFADKPGTMATLGGLAATLGRLPHDTFSPLIIVAMGVLYLSLVVFGARIGLPAWLSPVFALFGALSPSAWMIGTHTFLGNALALPFFPVVLSLVAPTLSMRAAVFGGVTLAAQTALFPDGSMALLGMAGLYALFLVWQTWRSRTLRRFLVPLATSLLVAIGLVLPIGWVLVVTALWRLDRVVSQAIPGLITGTRSTASGGSLHRMEPVDWIWGAFNLNTIPPSPLLSYQRLFLLAIVLVGALFVALCIWERRARSLSFYLTTLGILVVAGVFGGVFASDYELFRALAVFAFVPLSVVFLLPVAVARSTIRRRRIATALATVMSVVLLVKFEQVDRFHFEFGYSEHLADAQYTADDLRAREQVSRLAQTQSIVMSGETPTFTAFANVIMLFSPSHLGIPDGFRKFVFFAPREPQGTPYGADLVIFNRRYFDVWMPADTGAHMRFASSNFYVIDNDLVPFLDNDTLAPLHGLPRRLLETRQLPVRRVLKDQTAMDFNSRADRDVQLEIQFDPERRPGSLTVSLDGGPAIPVDVTAPAPVSVPLHVVPGLHRVVLSVSGGPAHVSSLRLTSVQSY